MIAVMISAFMYCVVFAADRPVSDRIGWGIFACSSRKKCYFVEDSCSGEGVAWGAPEARNKCCEPLRRGEIGATFAEPRTAGSFRAHMLGAVFE